MFWGHSTSIEQSIQPFGRHIGEHCVPKDPSRFGFWEQIVDHFPGTSGIWVGLMKETFSSSPLACRYLLPTYVMTLTEQWKLIELPDGASHGSCLWPAETPCQPEIRPYSRLMPTPWLICFSCSRGIEYWWEKFSFCLWSNIEIVMNHNVDLGCVVLIYKVLSAHTESLTHPQASSQQPWCTPSTVHTVFESSILITWETTSNWPGCFLNQTFRLIDFY